MNKIVDNSSSINIDDSNSEEFLEKILEEAKPFLKKSIFEWLNKRATKNKKQKVKDDPYQLSFDEFIKISEQGQRAWRHRILKEKKDWLIKEITNSKAAWLLILGGKVEIASPTLDDLPTKDKIYQIAKTKGFAPFIFVRDPLIEESLKMNEMEWSPLEGYDFYPTMNIFIGMENWSDDKFSNKENEINADFDTGSSIIVLDREELKKRDILDIDEMELSQIHLGKPYDYRSP